MGFTIEKMKVPPSVGGWSARYRCGDCGAVTMWAGPDEPSDDTSKLKCACQGDPLWHCAKCEKRMASKASYWTRRLCNECAPVGHYCEGYAAEGRASFDWILKTTAPVAVRWDLDIEDSNDGTVSLEGVTHCPWCGERLPT